MQNLEDSDDGVSSREAAECPINGRKADDFRFFFLVLKSGRNSADLIAGVVCEHCDRTVRAGLCI